MDGFYNLLHNIYTFAYEIVSVFRLYKIRKLQKMSQYSSSYNYDSLDDAFNAVNRKGKMQKSIFHLNI